MGGALNAIEGTGEPQKVSGRIRRWKLRALWKSLVGRQETGSGLFSTGRWWFHSESQVSEHKAQ